MDRSLRAGRSTALSRFVFDFHAEHRQHHQMDKTEIKRVHAV